MLELAVFICGAMIMILELAGVRLLAPYLGTSLFVWTSLIAVILASLSFGCWFGGRMADKTPEQKRLVFIIIIAALFAAVIPVISSFLLPPLRKIVGDIRLGTLIAGLLLFSPATFTLGMVCPFAVRLRVHEISKTGETVGRLYAWSTAGSIFGTLFSGLFLFAYMGTLQTFLIVGLILGLTAFVLAKKPVIGNIILLIAIIVLGLFWQRSSLKLQAEKGVVDIDTAYSRYLIIDQPLKSGAGTVRLLTNGACGVQGGWYFPKKDGLIPDPFHKINQALANTPQQEVFRYIGFFDLNKHFLPTQKRALMIGGGAYVYPRIYLKDFPKAQMDVVELDPAVTDLAHKYFAFENDPRLQIHHQDGRTYLSDIDDDYYDSIVIDAFTSACTVPFHLTTKEFVEKLHAVVKTEGIVLVNLISALKGQDGRFFQSLFRTYQVYFPQVFVFAVSSPKLLNRQQNLLLVAFKSDCLHSFSSEDSRINGYLQHLWQKPEIDDIPILEDNFAPVDYYKASLNVH